MFTPRRLSALLCTAFLVAASLVAAGCDGGGPAATEPPDAGDVDAFMGELPAWEDFSPRRPSQAAAPTGPAEAEDDATLTVERIDDDGEVYTDENVVYQCESQPYSITETPREIVTYSPNRDVLWAGNLIQGRTHRDGVDGPLSLRIKERAPIDVSIPSLANDDNFRRVERPTQSTVDQAIGSMIGAATQSGLDTPSSIFFQMRTYHSEQQSALEMNMSGRYLNFEASAGGSVERQASETTVTAQFYQKMYTVVVGQPSRPADMFSDAFTEEKLQQFVDDGAIGPNNPPLYVSSVVYGRMMMFSLTSTASEEDIRATMRAGYESIGGEAETNLSAKQKTILEEGEIQVTSFGGDAEATLAVIRSGDWSQYFTENAPLSSAEPLSYTFRNLAGRGEIARVTETTEYTLRTCTVRQAAQSTFDLLEAEDLGLPIPTPATSLLADIDGDGSDDLVWNHLGENNELAIAFSNGDGTFAAPVVSVHPDVTPEGWSKYTLVAGLVNRDDRVDLIWNHAGRSNRTFVAESRGDGSFDYFNQRHRVRNWGEAYSVHLADVNGDGPPDLVWNERRVRNRTYVAMGAGDGSFSMVEPYQDHPNTGWDGYDFFVRDVDADGRADLIWNETSAVHNRTYVGLYRDPTPGRHFEMLSPVDRGSGGWEDYRTLVGDVDGENGADLVFVDVGENPMPLHRHRSRGTGQFEMQGLAAIRLDGTANAFRPLLADVNGDGRDDFVLYNETMDELNVGLATTGGTFDFEARPVQSRPQNDDWSQFRLLVGDVDGDRRSDLVWTDASARNRVYVGLALGGAR